MRSTGGRFIISTIVILGLFLAPVRGALVGAAAPPEPASLPASASQTPLAEPRGL
jgi:hypothetical protein